MIISQANALLDAKFGGHRSYRIGHVNPLLISFMNISIKTEITTLIHHIERFSKLRIPIHSSEVPEKPQKALTKRYSLQAKAISKSYYYMAPQTRLEN